MAEGEPSGTDTHSPWSERASDWADVMEGWNGWGVPVYRRVLERASIGDGAAVLDVGCGAGRFARMAADRGHQLSGLDATSAFVKIASRRVPEGDFRVGRMEELPWPDDAFDLVVGFNSFFIADDMVGVLREAGRVARPGGAVATSVFGRPGHCDSTQIFAALGELFPSNPADDSSTDGEAASDPPLHEEGVLGTRAGEAGLAPREEEYLQFTEVYPDVETLLRGYLAAPPFRRAAHAVGEEKVRDTVAARAAPYKDAGGQYRLDEEVRYLIAGV